MGQCSLRLDFGITTIYGKIITLEINISWHKNPKNAFVQIQLRGGNKVYVDVDLRFVARSRLVRFVAEESSRVKLSGKLNRKTLI